MPVCKITFVRKSRTVPLEEDVMDVSFTISPNPFESTTQIKYLLHQPSQVSLKILDLRGREVVTVLDNVHQHEEQQVMINGSGLKPGVYFCTLKTNDEIQTKKIIKL